MNLPLNEIRPENFPVLTQAEIDTHFDQIVTNPKIKLQDLIAHAQSHTPDELYLNRFHILKTSGTTGTPHYFLAETKEVIESIAPSVARGPEVQKIKEKRRICMLGLKNSYCSSNQNLNVTNKLWIAKKYVDYQLIPMDQPIEKVIDILNKTQPHVVSGYAKLLLILADAQRAGRLTISPESLESGGEPLLHTDRKYLKDVFNCKVNNHYGSTEGYSMGICRDGEDSMELFEDHIIFEILENKVYITNLHNFTMPLIRFQMSDVLTPIKTYTPSPFLRVECGVGRPEGISYFTTQQNDQITVQPIEVDPLMPEGVKSFSIQGDKANYVNCIIFIDDQFKNQTDVIKNKTKNTLNEFFIQKGLPNLQIDITIGSDYKISPFSLKTQLWQKPNLQT
jgi:phenylacetate-coenzyme A ligase PaaK-like adenylate-forming protein